MILEENPLNRTKAEIGSETLGPFTQTLPQLVCGLHPFGAGLTVGLNV